MDQKNKKKKLNHQQTKALLPIMKEFNRLSKGLIQLLNKRIEKKEKKLNTIKVMVSEFTVPVKNHSLNIQTVDINKTVIKKKGQLSYNQSMSWEDDLRKKRRGLIL